MNILTKYANLRRRPLVGSVIVLASGTAFAQAISLLVLPLLTRLYTPADFSVFAVYTALVQIISVAACLRLEIAIPLPERDEDAANLLALAITSAAVIFALTALAVILVSTEALGSIGQHAVGPYLWLVPIGVLVGSVYSALQFWSTRKRQFSTISRTRVSQSVTAAVVQLGMGAIKYAPLGLLIGNLFQSGAGAVALARNIQRQDSTAMRAISLPNMKRVWTQYIRFPKYSVGEAVAQAGSLQLPIIFIAALSIGPEAGYLILALRVMQAPITLVGSAIAQVFASAAPDAHRENSLGVLAARTFGALLKSAVGPMIFLGIVAPQIFGVIFGAEWQRTGVLVSWLTPLFIAHMMAASLGASLYITNHQKLALVLQVFGLLIRVSAVWFASLFAVDWISEAYAISGFLFYLLYLVTALHCASTRAAQLWAELLEAAKYLLAWLAAGILVIIAVDFAAI